MAPPEFRDVLVALDGSVHAELALQSAGAIAERSNARLTLMTVAPDLATDARLAWATVDRGALQKDADEAAEKLLREAVDAQPQDLSVTSVFRHGSPGHEIVEQAKKGNHDVIVVGARGLGRFGGMVGSVSQDVLRHAPCSVIVVHQGPEDAAGV
jgi:nucleotide-binding universal stress UspA family protein